MRFSFSRTLLVLSTFMNFMATPQAIAYVDSDQEEALVESINQRLKVGPPVQELRCSRRHRTCWVKFSEEHSCTLPQVESTYDVMIDDDGLSPTPNFIKRIQGCSNS